MWGLATLKQQSLSEPKVENAKNLVNSDYNW